MFNPDFLNVDEQRLVLDALLALNNETYLEDGVVGDAVVTGCLDVNANTVDEDIAASQCGDQSLQTSSIRMGWFKPIRKRISAFTVLSSERFQEFRTTLTRNTNFILNKRLTTWRSTPDHL